MPEWRSGYVTANGARLHYTRTGGGDDGGDDGGGGKPPLVLAHGFSDDGLCWAPVAGALEPEFDVVMVDARGHGRSEAPENAGYGAAEQAADLAGVISALGLRRPAVLGHSMGAMTALALAGTHPDVPGAILLEDPPAPWTAPPPPPNPPPAPAAAEPPRPPGPPAWVQGLAGKTREELIEGQRAKTPHWSEAELGPWADAKLRFLPNAHKRGPGVPVDWATTLRHIACPALLITGDPGSGAIITGESAAGLRGFVPQLRIEHIAGAGHSIRRDRFDEFMAAVRTFLHDHSTATRRSTP